MIDSLAYAVMLVALVATGWGILTASLDKPPGRAQIVGAAVLELVTVVQSVIAGAQIAAGARPPSLATTVGYLIAIVLLVPLAALWALSERTRFSGVVLAVAAFSVLAMTLRLQTLWAGG
ncbi:MAG TPA: hypothetical protein VFP89_07155 [Propionibacteriaceae bacterium]|nr:hypothetical protein [Propionibacteriaceae bacterium]